MLTKKLRQVRYPIRYGRTGGNSVWKEKEIMDMMFAFQMADKVKCGSPSQESLIDELKSKEIEHEAKFQGEQKLLNHLESNPELSNFLYEEFKNFTNDL